MLTFIVPKTWKDIKLPQFEAALRVEEANYDDPIDRQLDWIAAICQTDREALEEMTIGEVSAIARRLEWIKCPNFNEKIPRFFTCAGRLFELTWRIDKITAAQYAELCTWMKDKPMLNLHKVMASVSTERKFWLLPTKYNGATHEWRANLFRRHLSMAVIYPVALFFFRLLTRSMHDIEIYLEKEKIRHMREMVNMIKKEVKSAKIS